MIQQLIPYCHFPLSTLYDRIWVQLPQVYANTDWKPVDFSWTSSAKITLEDSTFTIHGALYKSDSELLKG